MGEEKVNFPYASANNYYLLASDGKTTIQVPMTGVLRDNLLKDLTNLLGRID